MRAGYKRRARFVDTDVGVWCPATACCIRDIKFCLEEKKAILWLPEMNVTDMTGVVHLVENFDGRIDRIEVYKGGELDIVYSKVVGDWRSQSFRRQSTAGPHS